MLFIRTLILFILLILTAVGSGGFWIYQYKLKAPLPLLNDWHYTLRANRNLSQVAMDLMKKELLDYPTALTWVTLARLNKDAHKIKAGNYTIPVGTTPQEFLAILISGKPTQYSLTIVEGWDFNQLLEAIRNHSRLKITLKDLTNRTIETKNLDKKAIMAQLDQPNQHPEGRFYPDTYFFPAGFSDKEFLQRAYQKMETELATAWAKRQPNLPLKTPEDALTLASIVEKETGLASERREVAGVFIRRLRKGMRLQTDPTVYYAVGKPYTESLTNADLKVDNPYNTYVKEGLPPTPIALPGRGALEAAVNPAEGNALYFVAKGGGEPGHYFSVSLAEHECAVIKYRINEKKNLGLYKKTLCLQHPTCPVCRPDQKS